MKQTRPSPSSAAAVLEPSIVQALDAAQTAAALPPGLHERVRSRVLQRIAQDSTPRHLTIAASADGFLPFLPGIERKVLHKADGIMSYLLRLAPGAVLPAHRHPVDEECVVLSGELHIGQELQLRAGDFHLGRRHIAHAPIGTDSGAIIFLRGAVPRADLLI